MPELYIAGTVIGILLIAAAGYWINKKQQRHSSRFRAETPQGSDEADMLVSLATSPLMWGLIFFAVLAFVAVGTLTVLFDPLGLGIGATTAIGGLFGAMLVGFISYNVYAVARNRGHSNALSIAQSIGVLLLFAFATVALSLVMG